MVINAVSNPGVEIKPALDGEGLKEMANKVSGKAGHVIITECQFQYRVSPATDVNRNRSQSIVHGHSSISHADNTPLLAQGFTWNTLCNGCL